VPPPPPLGIPVVVKDAHTGLPISGATRDKASAAVPAGQAWLGMLTGVGVSQCAAVGAALRAEYVVKQGLLGSTWDEKEVYVRSTYFTRTLGTAAVSCVASVLTAARVT
jgi:hypothetical protein